MLTLEVAHVIVAIVVVVVLIVAAALISWKSAINYHIKVGEAKVGSAEEKAREIIDDALKTAETKKREALLEAKEENLKAKNDLEKETKERRAEIQRYEKRVLGKEETLDKKLDALEKRESKLNSREANFEKEKEKVAELRQSHLRELEKISGLTSEQAKEYLLKTVEDDVKHETAKLVKEMEARAKEEAKKLVAGGEEIVHITVEEALAYHEAVRMNVKPENIILTAKERKLLNENARKYREKHDMMRKIALEEFKINSDGTECEAAEYRERCRVVRNLINDGFSNIHIRFLKPLILAGYSVKDIKDLFNQRSDTEEIKDFIKQMGIA